MSSPVFRGGDVDGIGGDRVYVPGHFDESRIDALRAFVAQHPLVTLVSRGAEGLIASHLPMLWDPEPAPLGTLRGHIARPNPQREVVGDYLDALAIFVGPAAYVSPNWYPSKREHGKVVPTWNYMAVHAYGPLAIIEDVAWLRAFVTRLTTVHEAHSAEPWQVTDAPGEFIEAMLKGIVGIEIPIARVEGKWKLSQNRSASDRAGTITGLAASQDAASQAVAAAMRTREPSR
jgi:transcriptional regulator